MDTQERMMEAAKLRLRFQMNNRLRLESLAALSRVFREHQEPVADDLLASLVFAVPEELLGEMDPAGIRGPQMTVGQESREPGKPKGYEFGKPKMVMSGKPGANPPPVGLPMGHEHGKPGANPPPVGKPKGHEHGKPGANPPPVGKPKSHESGKPGANPPPVGKRKL